VLVLVHAERTLVPTPLVPAHVQCVLVPWPGRHATVPAPCRYMFNFPWSQHPLGVPLAPAPVLCVL